MKELIVSILHDAIGRARAAGQLTAEIPAIGIEAPRDSAHGDVASNIALTLAKPEGKAPRAIAEVIKSQVTLPAEVTEVSVAGPGFINFNMAPAYWHAELREPPAPAARSGSRASCEAPGAGKKVQVEFLSANPTGPLSRSATGATPCSATPSRDYEAAASSVTREYYFNDGGRQMKLLGESVRVRYLEELGLEAAMPPDGYEGEYIGQSRAGSEKIRRRFGSSP